MEPVNTSSPRRAPPERRPRRGDLRDAIVTSAIALLCLAPFAGKAVHIDDPLYLWAAQQIQEDPFDFYGFDVNWYGFETPMVEVNKNPPLVSYYLAFSAALLGWSEWALHLAMLIPAIAVVVSVTFLARFLGASPIGAALTTLFMPAMFVSSTTLMSDVLMLAFWCGSLTLWIWGLRNQRDIALVSGAILAGLCPLVKYLGVSLLPLLVAFSLISERRLGRWPFYLIIPIGFIVGYEILMVNLYDHRPFIDASDYAIEFGKNAELLTGLVFLGGCLLPALLFSPLLWKRYQILVGVAIAAAGGIALSNSTAFEAVALELGGGFRWGLVVQGALFFVSGVSILALAASDLTRDRSASGWLLALWVGGVFAFAAFANWTVNARAVLPAAPAVAILIWRRISLRFGAESSALTARRSIAPITASLAVAAAVAWGDWQLADNARVAASRLVAKYGSESGKLWFQGAWGFQYYMEANGGRRIYTGKTILDPNDILISPKNNTNVYTIPDAWGLSTTIETFSLPVRSWVSTMSPQTGAGLYTSLWGPLPYVFGPTPPEAYRVQRMEKSTPLR